MAEIRAGDAASAIEPRSALIGQSLAYIAGKALPGAIGFAASMVLTRLLDPEAFGIYGLGLAVMTICASLFFEWNGLTYARFSQGPQPEAAKLTTFIGAHLALVGLTAVLLALFWASGLLAPYRAVGTAGVVGSWFYAWFELRARIEVAALRSGRFLTMNVARAGLIFAFACGTAWATRDPVLALVASFGAMLLSSLVFPLGVRGVAPRRFDRALFREALRFGLPMACSMTLFTFIQSSSRVLIEMLSTTAAVGLFTAGYMLVQNSVALLASAVATATYAHAVRAVEHGDAAATTRQLEQNATLLLLVLLPAATGLALLAPDIARLAVGEAYVAAVTVLTPWMALGALLSGLRATYLDHAFQLGHRTGAQIGVMGLAALVSVALHVALVPRLAEVGAAIAIDIALAVALVHSWHAGRRCFPMPLPGGAFARIALADLAMTAVLLPLAPLHGPAWLLVKVPLGAAAFGAAATALNVLGLRDLLRDARPRLSAAVRRSRA